VVVDFFASQELARRKTRLMIALFLLAVVATVLGVYLVAFAAVHGRTWARFEGPRVWVDPRLLAGVSLAVLTVIVAGSLYKIAQLGQGGSQIALLLGGRQLTPNSTDIAERRLLNVVEEMAIASGTPVPPVYVLDSEPGINAFAAGFTADDAVIGVNRGTLDQLNRDELQGVIAHEFSHILNGDMRMSLRMIGILHGIQLIALIGYFILRSAPSGRSSSSSEGRGGGHAVLLLLGVGLLVVGSIGLLFARLIKASVSRQREYLADASALQFTRNPDGIGGALKMIGAHTWGSRVSAPNAEVASHMYFAHMFGHHMLGWMSTHPPLVTRIRRIDPRFNGDFGEYLRIHRRRAEQAAAAGEDREEQKARTGWGRWLPPQVANRFPLDPLVLVAGVGAPSEDDVVYSQVLRANAPDSIYAAVRDLFSARCVALAMLLHADHAVRDQQLAMIRDREGQPTLDETLRIQGLIRDLSPALRLPMFEILQGTLAGMSQPQYQNFRGTVAALTDADRQTSIFEFFLRQHLIVYLDRRFGKARPGKVLYESLDPVKADALNVLSLLVHCGHRDPAQAQAAFAAATASFPTAGQVQLGSVQGATQLDQSLQRLSQAAPRVKKLVLSAAATAITHDRTVTVEEAEIFRAIAESLDCPVPPIVATSPQLRAATPPDAVT
jgi:Zn-dependent protease with chaperone function